MSPELRMALVTVMFSSGVCVLQKLATLKMAIRVEADSQKALAIDSGMDESQLARKLSDKAPLTLREIDRLPEEVQKHWHLAELERMGLPARVQKWVSIARAVEAREKQSA